MEKQMSSIRLNDVLSNGGGVALGGASDGGGDGVVASLGGGGAAIGDGASDGEMSNGLPYVPC